MKEYYVVLGKNHRGNPIVLDTHKGWQLYRIEAESAAPLGRHFKSRAESKRATTRAQRMFPGRFSSLASVRFPTGRG